MAAIRLPTFEFYHRLSRREQVLLLAVGGTVLLVLNLIVISVVLRSSRELNTQLAEKSLLVRTEQNYASEETMWKKRSEWVKATQPVLTSRDRAGTELLSLVQQAARVAGVVLTNPTIKPPPLNNGAAATKVDFQPVTVAFETQGDWGQTVRFLAAVQKRESFLVFDDAALTTDAGDATRMKSRFTLSKWYAGGR